MKVIAKTGTPEKQIVVKFDGRHTYTVAVVDGRGKSLVRAKRFSGECSTQDANRYFHDLCVEYNHGHGWGRGPFELIDLYTASDPHYKYAIR